MKTYVTVQGDTWDQIAKKVYGKETYADFLMESNRLLLDELIFSGGVILSVPELPEEQEADLPIWRD